MRYALGLDHVSLLVRSLDVSTKFYTEVLGFDVIHNGTEKSHIRWFGIGGIDSLHITQGEFGKTHLEKPTHFAMRVENFDALVADFRARGIKFWDWPGKEDNVTGRPDGFRQIYVQDPDGYWIEINDHTRDVA
jgi:lactoylglutathione lyase